MTDAERTFNIGVSRKLLNPDMSAVIKEFDFDLLLNNPRVKLSTLADVDTGVLPAAEVQDLDAAILFLEKISNDTVSGADSGSLDKAGRLSVLARYGVGFDTLDIQACTNANVAVAIAPEGVRRPVATTVIALMLALTLNLKQKDRLTRDIPNGWNIKSQFNGTGLVGRTLGLVGLGNIGAEVVRLAAPFDLELIACDPAVSADEMRALGVRRVELDTVFSDSDIVSLNCPLSDDTHHLANRQKLSLMKPGAFLINTARGPVVEEAALIEALQQGRIAGAGLDVFEQEPPDPSNPLLQMENVLLSPHALCFTDQCMGGLGEADVKACLAIMHGRLPDKLVNPEVVDNPQFKQKLDGYKARFRA